MTRLGDKSRPSLITFSIWFEISNNIFECHFVIPFGTKDADNGTSWGRTYLPRINEFPPSNPLPNYVEITCIINNSRTIKKKQMHHYLDLQMSWTKHYTWIIRTFISGLMDQIDSGLSESTLIGRNSSTLARRKFFRNYYLLRKKTSTFADDISLNSYFMGSKYFKKTKTVSSSPDLERMTLPSPPLRTFL